MYALLLDHLWLLPLARIVRLVRINRHAVNSDSLLTDIVGQSVLPTCRCFDPSLALKHAGCDRMHFTVAQLLRAGEVLPRINLRFVAVEIDRLQREGEIADRDELLQ